MDFDLSGVREVTEEFGHLRKEIDCINEHGFVHPVAFMDATAALAGRSGTWIGPGSRVLVQYSSDNDRHAWYAELKHVSDDGRFHSLGFVSMDDMRWPPRVGLSYPLSLAVGISEDDLRALYLACAPEPLRESMAKAGVVFPS